MIPEPVVLIVLAILIAWAFFDTFNSDCRHYAQRQNTRFSAAC